MGALIRLEYRILFPYSQFRSASTRMRLKKLEAGRVSIPLIRIPTKAVALFCAVAFILALFAPLLHSHACDHQFHPNCSACVQLFLIQTIVMSLVILGVIISTLGNVASPLPRVLHSVRVADTFIRAPPAA